jgi:acylphosphatase
VQGVGFRFSVVQAASGFPVKGFVRNQVDGSVLVVAEGHPQQLEAFVLRIYRVATGARISGEERRESAATNEFDGFHVRYA